MCVGRWNCCVFICESTCVHICMCVCKYSHATINKRGYILKNMLLGHFLCVNTIACTYTNYTATTSLGNIILQINCPICSLSLTLKILCVAWLHIHVYVYMYIHTKMRTYILLYTHKYTILTACFVNCCEVY